MNTAKWAAQAVKVGLFLATLAVLVCAAYMSQVGCPACLVEFASNGVKPDVLALELPAGGDELRRTLYLGKPFSQAVRDIYEKQTNVDDVFLWLYPAQFVLTCFYFTMTGETKLSRLQLIAAAVVMVFAGRLDHRENSFIHAILRDSGAHFNQLAASVRHASTQKWLCFGVAAFLSATGLVLQIRGGGPKGLTKSEAGLLCAILTLVFALVMVGMAAGNREVIGSSALAYSLFPLALLWLLYLKPLAEKIDDWLRSRLGLHHSKD